MFKGYLIGVVLFLSFVSSGTPQEVYACSLADVSKVYIRIDGKEGESRQYNYDLLVEKSANEEKLNTGISIDYIASHRNYESFDYLNNTDWVSYLAYGVDSEIDQTNNWAHFPLVDDAGYLEYKIIVFDNLGNIKYTSETLSINETYGYEETRWDKAKTHVFDEKELEMSYDIHNNPCDAIEALNYVNFFIVPVVVVFTIIGVIVYIKKTSWR